MDGLSAAASIIAVVQITTSVIGYLNDIKSAPEECSDASIELSNLNTLLLKLKKECTKTNPTEPWHKEIKALAVKDGPLDQYKAAIEKLLEKINPTSKFRKTLNNLVWSLIKDDVATTMARLHRLMTLVNIALEMDQLNLSRAIKQDTTTLANAQNNRQHEEMLTWLSRVDFFAQKNGIIADRYETTGTWFLNTTEFQQWLSQDRQTMFCQGIPGAGKSMMAAIVIDHLCQTVRSKDVEVVCIFCNYKTTLEQSTSELLAAALKQLVPSREDTLTELNKIYQKCLQEKRKPSHAELVETLKTVSGKYRTVYIVVDALDECSNESGTRTELIHDLQQLQILSDLRLLYTSRVVPEIERESKWSLKMELSATEDDVRRFVRGKLPTLPAFVLKDEELSRQVETRIAEATDGMFLLARLYAESLRASTTKKIVKSKLAGFQKRTVQGNNTAAGKENQALRAAYKDALDRIDRHGYRDLAKSALSWIIHARQHLTTKQLREALAIEIGESSLDADNMPSMEDVVSACTGLVLVDDTIGVVRLVHYTTEEFFARERLTWIPEAEKHIAKACLTYMSFEVFRTGPCDDEEAFQQRMSDNSLATYFMKFFDKHLQPVENQLREFCRLRGFFQDNSLNEAVWQIWRTCNDFMGYIQIRDTKPNILHVLAACGLEALVEEALIDGVEPDPLDESCRTPLSWAAEQGHEAVVKLLLARDNVHADSGDDTYGQTPLSWAARNGHEAVVRLLLAQDDVHADSRDDTYGQTPLSWAAKNGHEAVVKLLLARDDVHADSRDKYGQTPLSQAAKNGHEAVVKLLLARDDIHADSRDGNGQTPLSWAARNGHEAVVKLLLARDDVDADLRDEHGRTPLSWAASCEDSWIKSGAHNIVVKLLLEQGDVDVNSRDNGGRRPLSWAIETEGAVLQKDKVRTVVKLLLLARPRKKLTLMNGN